MRAVIQRVKNAEVVVDGVRVSRIDRGILTLLGVAKGDTEEMMVKLITKIVDLRVFEDEAGRLNLSLKDVGGAHLIVSQFTLAGDCSSGRRPSFINAERPELARPIYDHAIELSRALGVETAGGVFQADMKIALVNDGPVTFVLDQR